ncbi:MAG: MBOAT family protein [Alphaproteobacteria bacterium]|nr:MBOAT family protein [Alphaproteobacteria bacterium]
MLFNSFVFIFAFLPATLALYFLGRHYLGLRYANGILVICSLFFYAWWSPPYLLLIVFSIVGNFLLSRLLFRTFGRLQKWILGIGIGANLALLGYFKYTAFLVDNLTSLLYLGWPVPQIVLPIGISFYTFQQIAFLVDVGGRHRETRDFINYALFISFFPQLIAGPIVFHNEMMPQFAQPKSYARRRLLFAVGLTLFVIGLSKKVLIADSVALFSTPVFDAALVGTPPSLIESWGGVLAYTFQIYFDFSGYSDMAAGLALLFGIRLPINFFSPYKSASIIEFWRRWHITLSRFLRDFVYIPLGGNRVGETRRIINILVTMLLGGIWHGAAWTFAIWGALHGIFICINHIWRKLPWHKSAKSGSALTRFLSRTLTFILVVIAWAFFRAETTDSALLIVTGMFGGHGIGLPAGLANLFEAANAPCSAFRICGVMTPNDIVNWEFGLPLLAALLAVVWLAPNSYELLGGYRPMLLILDNRVERTTWSFKLRLNWKYGILIGLLFGICTIIMTGESEFLYFQF